LGCVGLSLRHFWRHSCAYDLFPSSSAIGVFSISAPSDSETLVRARNRVALLRSRLMYKKTRNATATAPSPIPTLTTTLAPVERRGFFTSSVYRAFRALSETKTLCSVSELD